MQEFIAWAATDTAFTTPPHPGNHHVEPQPDGWKLTWGAQLDTRPVNRLTDGEITEQQVAGYIAKYATKSTEATGFRAQRLTSDTINHVADPDTHIGRLLTVCWDLGANPHDTDTVDAAGCPVHPEFNQPLTPQRAAWRHTYGRLRRWAHMLGFGGHFATRSRHYGPTRTHLKNIRRDFRRSQQLLRRSIYRTAEHLDDEEDTTLVVGDLAYAGIGWLTPGDAELALTAAAKAREYATTARQERPAAAA